MTKTKDVLLWVATIFFAIFFVFVVVGMIRTMNANDRQFDGPPTTSTGGG